jgi:hypothetical protein
MAEGDGTSIHVDLLWVEFQLAHAVHTHGSESLIDLRSFHMSHPFLFMWIVLYCTSNRSTSSVVIPTFAKTFGMAIEGPMPIIRGVKPAQGAQLTGRSTHRRSPVTATLTYFARIRSLNSFAFRLVINSTAAAPSVI